MERYSNLKASHPNITQYNRYRGTMVGLGGLSAIGMGFQAISGVSSMVDQLANPNKRPQIMHESFTRRQGQAGRNFSIGVDPTSGLRFSARYKRRF